MDKWAEVAGRVVVTVAVAVAVAVVGAVDSVDIVYLNTAHFDIVHIADIVYAGVVVGVGVGAALWVVIDALIVAAAVVVLFVGNTFRCRCHWHYCHCYREVFAILPTASKFFPSRRHSWDRRGSILEC